jgi:hypothetical protein
MLSEDAMSLRLATVHENSLPRRNPFVFNKRFVFFHGGEASLCFFENKCRDPSLRSEMTSMETVFSASC